VLGVHIDGGMRPEIVVPARKLHRSNTLAYEQLALVETLGIGAHAVERANIERDDFVLVIGAGPIGLSVSQFVSVRGATLAVMDLRESRLDFCRRHLGVTHTLVAGPDAVDEIRRIGGGELPTVVMDATGSAASMAGTFDLPAQGGRIVFVGLFQGEVSFNDPNFHRRELTIVASRNALPHNFREIIALIEAGRINTSPWISHRFDLADTPQRFPEIAANSGVIKAVIHV
jgi:2-desacetyl-2-hydroxyethyl bacteriochlorophyllide A dehydrogenase